MYISRRVFLLFRTCFFVTLSSAGGSLSSMSAKVLRHPKHRSLGTKLEVVEDGFHCFLIVNSSEKESEKITARSRSTNNYETREKQTRSALS
ncbi:hypothetical protein EDD18DRAFT_181016 [Armillaria luteobubalina]|uniref:Secreted protein n=1 Tax=Armillaria luteobubalina TaxID=153913 RepID=A0AA39Q5Z5_9AGAR|nr:hypothetical protein EDD18DRAFT_181016 [Armillaria luteobubalina]